MTPTLDSLQFKEIVFSIQYDMRQKQIQYMV